MTQATLTYGGAGATALPELSQGSTGDDVKKLQQQLADLGYDVGAIDADYGPRTAAAVTKFQQDTGGLQVDAIAGPQTMSALYGTTLATAAGKQALGGTAEDFTKLAQGAGGGPEEPTPEELEAEREAQKQRNAEKPTEVVPVKPTEVVPVKPPEVVPVEPVIPKVEPVVPKIEPVEPEVKPVVPVEPEVKPTEVVPVKPTEVVPVKPPEVGKALTFEDILAGMNKGTNVNMLPYETALRDLLAKMPNQAGMTPEQILASAQQYARTITDPQALALKQGLEQLRSSATGQAGQIEAGYAGAEESANRLLTEAEARAVEDAIRRGGGRAGLVPYLQGKYGQPITEQFARGQAQKAASLADVQRQLGLGESQIQGRQEQLAQTQGNLTAQQQQALGDLQYARQTGDWQRAWAATESLMSAATQAGQYGQQVALSVLPYTALTEYQRQRLPLEWAGVAGVTPEKGPGALVTQPEEPVSVREYAKQKGMGGAIDWDPVTEEIIINGQRIPLSSLTGMGGYETGGTAYLPKAILDRYLGLGA